MITIDTVGTVAQVGWRGCFQSSLDDRSGYHHVLLQPQSWVLFGFNWRGIDYVWTTLSFGWIESPFVYSTLSEAKAQFFRRHGIPVLSYIDDSSIGNPLESRHGSEQSQWVEAARALRFAITVAFLCGYYLAEEKCALVPTQSLRYLGITCDSRRAVFRVQQDKLDKLHVLIESAIRDKFISIATSERVTGKCVSMKVAIQPAALWTHFIFQTLQTWASMSRFSNRYRVRLVEGSGLWEELLFWRGLSRTSREGPWYKAVHYSAVFFCGTSDASPTAWGGLITVRDNQFRARGDFPREWVRKHITAKEAFALFHLLREYGNAHRDTLRGTQVRVDVDNQAVVQAFSNGRSRNTDIHQLLLAPFQLQVRECFWLHLRWVPTQKNSDADRMIRLGIEGFVRLPPEVFQRVWNAFCPFIIGWQP